MCKLGDIIVVKNYISEDGKMIGRHSFIVVDDSKGCISGLDYDLVTTVISSFKSEEHKKKKLSYKENMEIINYIDDNNKLISFKKKSYIKVDKMYYFNKEKIDYYMLGRMTKEMFNRLIILVENLKQEKRINKNIKNL